MILLKVGGGGPQWEGGQEKFSGRGVEERREDRKKKRERVEIPHGAH